VSTRQRRIAELARPNKRRALPSWNHHLGLDRLPEAYRGTRRDGAPGADGRTVRDYQANLAADPSSEPGWGNPPGDPAESGQTTTSGDIPAGPLLKQ
jgi:hypothetical protein